MTKYVKINVCETNIHINVIGISQYPSRAMKLIDMPMTTLSTVIGGIFHYIHIQLDIRHHSTNCFFTITPHSGQRLH